MYSLDEENKAFIPDNTIEMKPIDIYSSSRA